MRIFLSYHTPDRDKARALKTALEATRPDAKVFFDETSLRYGHLWQPALSKHIQECDAFIILVASRAGDWQKFEYYEARDRKTRDDRFILLPVILVDPAREVVANLPGLTQLHWVMSPEPSAPEPLARIIAALSDSDEQAPVEPWRLVDPYRGLQSLDEQDSDFFFGREAETAGILDAIAEAPGQLLTLIGNSGVGKSSLAKAGVLGALKAMRAPEGKPWPARLADSRQWAFLTMTPGNDPFEALVAQFLELWQIDPTNPDYTARRRQWVSHLRAASGEAPYSIVDLINATDATLKAEPRLQTPPPRYMIYLDQGEELYTRTAEPDRLRFSQLLAEAIRAMPARLTVMTSLRADYYGALQANEHLLPLARKFDVAPLGEAQLTRVLAEPARVLRARFENPTIVEHIVRSAGRQLDILPLLADLFRDLWQRMRSRGDGVLRISDHPEIIQVGAAFKYRAERFLSENPGKVDAVRRLFCLSLAQVPRIGEPVRAELIRDDTTPQGRAAWALAEELAGPEMRLLVTGTKDGVSKAWVAHEVLLRSWNRLAEWLERERDFLVWKAESDVRQQLHAKSPPAERHKTLLMGLDLDLAVKWQRTHAADLSKELDDYISQSRSAATRANRNRQRLQASVGALLVLVIAGLVAYINEQALSRVWFQWRYVDAKSAAELATLKPGDSFLDCGDITGEPGTSRKGYSEQCPEMVIIPAGTFMMGSPDTEVGRSPDEGPQHEVTIARPFAVSRFEVTAEQWRHCVRLGGCETGTGGGDGLEPVASVSWKDAQAYVAWLSALTGEDYRLLTEAEWEYAARAGTTTAYPWGNTASHNFANYGTDECCDGHAEGRDRWVNTAPVGSFPANVFGLHDMHGNLFEWTEDCWNDSYAGAPSDGSARRSGDCSRRVLRGGTWNNNPQNLRSANRNRNNPTNRNNNNGFRVASTLSARTAAFTDAAGEQESASRVGHDEKAWPVRVRRQARLPSCPAACRGRWPGALAGAA